MENIQKSRNISLCRYKDLLWTITSTDMGCQNAKDIRCAEEFKKEIKQTYNLYVAIFYVGQVAQIKCVVEALARQYKDVKFLCCDKNNVKPLIDEYNIKGDPETLLFKNGERVQDASALDINIMNVLRGQIAANQ